MRTILIATFLCLVVPGAKCQSLQQHQLDDVHHYLSGLLEAAQAKDKEKLEQLIYTSEGSENDYRKTTIEYILKNDESSSGDFSFSISALETLVASLSGKFQPIPDDLREMLNDDPDGVFKNATLNLKNEEIPVFDYNDCHIILVNRENEIRLLFWENLNNLK